MRQVTVFDEMLTEAIALHKADGQVKNNIRARVSGDKVLIDDVTLKIEVGDKLVRSLPSGLKEELVVVDPGFNQGLGMELPPHFQVRVRKEWMEKANPQAVTYNVSGPNARVNVHSHDHSTNTVTFGSSAPVFGEVRKALEQVNDEDARAKLQTSLDALEAAQHTPEYATRFAGFVQLAANWMTILSPLLPALAEHVSVTIK